MALYLHSKAAQRCHWFTVLSYTSLAFLCLFDENEILFQRWWKIVESVKTLGMEHSLSHLAAISEGKNFLHPSCSILKLIGISNTAWQSLNMRQVARLKECVCSRVGAKRGSWASAVELLGGRGRLLHRSSRLHGSSWVTGLPRKLNHLLRNSTN